MADVGAKNKQTAALLAIFLGMFGVHHFYLGSSLAGIVCIAASWLMCGVGWLLAIVEGIMLLMMTDSDFDAKYNQRVPEGMEFVFTGPKS
jgi:TM2 domain-containing membrane protein YozV